MTTTDFFAVCLLLFAAYPGTSKQFFFTVAFLVVDGPLLQVSFVFCPLISLWYFCTIRISEWRETHRRLPTYYIGAQHTLCLATNANYA